MESSRTSAVRDKVGGQTSGTNNVASRLMSSSVALVLSLRHSKVAVGEETQVKSASQPPALRPLTVAGFHSGDLRDVGGCRRDHRRRRNSQVTVSWVKPKP
uniref:Uncharacterized protein n=1 Tax=Opuntia streptacantha TaxID=393608 RepID=A0A7C8ZVN4_OPUST